MTYDELVLNSKKKVRRFKLVNSIMDWGKELQFNSEYINSLNKRRHDSNYTNLTTTKASLDELKAWMVPLILETHPRWTEVEVSFAERDLSVATCYWFWFIRSSIMTSQNEIVLYLSKRTCLGLIISRKSINMGLIIQQEIHMWSKLCKTSLPFPILIT